VGLFDYFKRRRERESAIPEGDVVAGASDVPSTPAPAAMTPGTMQERMIGLQRLMAAHEVNLTQQPMEVRQAVASDLQAHGINAQVGGALQITDPQQIHDVVQVLKDHGLLPSDVTVN
jgi:hypothetical protein